jgi:hypothetical protein
MMHILTPSGTPKRNESRYSGMKQGFSRWKKMLHSISERMKSPVSLEEPHGFLEGDKPLEILVLRNIKPDLRVSPSYIYYIS